MLKALVRKEFLRLLSSLNAKKTRKKNNQQVKQNPAGMIVLWIFVFFSLAMAFSGVCHMLGDALIQLSFDWLYYAIIGILGFVLSIIGNGFMASSMLFKAKDNSLLLSMPIPASYILGSRTLVIFILSIVYAIIPLAPAMVVRAMYINDGFAMPKTQILNGLVMILLSAFVTTAVSIWLGWLISIISNHTKHKSLVTVILSISFLSIYYYFNFNSQKYLKILVENSMAIGEKMQSLGILWPIYQFGHSMAGESKALMLFALFTVVFFALTYYVVSKSFVKIATTTENTADFKYEAEKQANVEMLSSKKTLLRKELKKFLSSPTYMMNCGLGLLFIIAAAVMLFIKRGSIDTVFNTFQSMGMSNDIPVICTAVVLMTGSMNTISSPSVSLEGKSLWILKSLPIKTDDIFYAKTYLGVYMGAVPTLILDISLLFVLKIEGSDMVILTVTSLIYILLISKLGLILNLKYPKFDWTSEAIPIKQSLPVVLIMFCGWIFAAGYFALYNFVLKDMINSYTYMGIMLVVIALCTKLCDKWLATRGKEIFESYEA